jgi:polyhydroxyalkanoate synthesis regulator phasin
MADTTRSEAFYPESSVTAATGTTFQRARWLALGLLTTLGEQTTRVAQALVEKGREVEPGVLESVKRTTSGVSEATGNVGAGLRRMTAALGEVRVPAALRRTARPTKEEFERLVEEVKDLRARIEHETDSAGRTER